jgi:hypothetical protein
MDDVQYCIGIIPNLKRITFFSLQYCNVENNGILWIIVNWNFRIEEMADLFVVIGFFLLKWKSLFHSAPIYTFVYKLLN